MKRIAITGPESCGKTSLSEAIAEYYQTDFVPEFAREYLLAQNGQYDFHDLDIITQGQLNLMEQAQGEIRIFDTEMLVMYIWSLVRFNQISPLIEQALKVQKIDLYILCDTDIPWTYDPLRENEYDRDDLFRLYYKKLRELKVNFIIAQGSPEQRLKTSVEAIAKL